MLGTRTATSAWSGRGGDSRPPTTASNSIASIRRFKSDYLLVPWVHEGEWTPSDRASESRTLRRLENRGLVIRANMKGDNRRTTHVQLTKAGAAIIRDK